MLGSTVLDVVVGTTFVFLLMSTLCAALREGLESMLKTRAAYLEQGIRALLADNAGTGLAQRVFRHPLIYGLYLGDYKAGPTKRSVLARGYDLPSYIPARNFARALLDLAGARGEADVAAGARAPLSARAIRENLAKLDNRAVQMVIVGALDEAGDDLDEARRQLELWFDSAMDRVTGWYKRSTQWIMLWLALAVSVGVNVDVIRIAQFLYHDEAARSVLVERARLTTADTAYLEKNAREVQEDLRRMTLPIGWETDPLPATSAGMAMRILGWLLTAIGTTLGAPFWFDVLNKVMVVRSTFKPSDKRVEEPNEPAAKPAPPRIAALIAPAHETHDGGWDDEPDACDGEMGETPDDQLPAAEGGVTH